MKVVRITEEQYNLFLKEGVDYKSNGDGTIDMHINTKSQDKYNVGANSVDTRVFGSKNDVLNGDGTTSGRTQSLSDKYSSRKATEDFYKNVIDWVKGGRKGEVNTDGVGGKTLNGFQEQLKKNASDSELISWATMRIGNHSLENEILYNKYNRAANAQDGEKVARYNVGTVPYTNVKFIALFTMEDFNFSDAIKHGKLRQNGNTDKLLGITDKEREKNGRSYASIPVTYDNGDTPDIAGNFSLSGVKDMHYKQNYGYKGDGGYNSVTQFMDKSIQYASYALKQEHFTPDFIIAAPSSSKFNEYFCTNLSRKIGVPYVKDFFKRNIINVRYDNKDADTLLSNGFTETDVETFKSLVKNVAYNEISYFIAEPIRQFITRNEGLFSGIRTAKYSRDVVSLNDIIDCTLIYAYQSIVENLSNNAVSTHLVQNFMAAKNKLYNKKYDSINIFNAVCKIVNGRGVKEGFQEALTQMYDLVSKYSATLAERGYKVNLNSTKFKITKFDKRFRPYLNNVYIIADKALSSDNSGNMLKQYQNGKFLIYDEDINSGGTLKLVIDILQEKLPAHADNNIICLTNAYSSSGK